MITNQSVEADMLNGYMAKPKTSDLVSRILKNISKTAKSNSNNPMKSSDSVSAFP